MSSVKLQSSQNFVRVNFSNRGLRKVVKSVRSLGADTPNRSAVVEIADLLHDVQVESQDPVQFVSIPEFVGVDYVGYIIEKERLDKKTGNWIRIDEYRIVGSLSNSFKDSRLVYGNYYRYRIKSIVKVTYSVKKKSSEDSESVETVKHFEADLIKKSMQAKQEVISAIENVTNRGLSHQVSSGQVTSTFDFLDGLSIRADEEKTSVSHASVNVSPGSSRQLRQLVASDPALMTGGLTLSDLQRLSIDEARKAENITVEYFSQYYESEPSVNWIYVSAFNPEPPPPPTAIKIIPNTSEQSIAVTWLTPAYPKKTITGICLYRRESVGQRWRKIKTFTLRDNFYVDQEVVFNREYIYALTSVDIHGIESFLSIQTQAELNPNFTTERRERPLRWISGSGARPDKGFSDIFKKFYENEVPIVARNNVVIGPTRVFKEIEKKLLVRITSLDIHEVKEFVVVLRNEKISSPDSE